MDLSSISLMDQVNFIGHFNFVATEQESHSKKLASRGYTEEQLAQLAQHQSVSRYKTLNVVFTKPLEHFQSDIYGYALTLFNQYEKGNLPFPGSVSEQPAQVMELFELISALKQEHIERLQKQQQKAMKKNG